MRSLERVNIRTNERTYVLTYIRTGQTLYPLHNFVVRGDNHIKIILNLQLWDFSKGLKNEFETALANELSVFKPLKGALVAQWIKRWPTDLADRVQIIDYMIYRYESAFICWRYAFK